MGGGGGGGGDSIGAAAAILFGAGKRDENAWDCPACTFHNAGGNVRCDVCDGLRPGAAVGPVVGGGASSSERAGRRRRRRREKG